MFGEIPARRRRIRRTNAADASGLRSPAGAAYCVMPLVIAMKASSKV